MSNIANTLTYTGDVVAVGERETFGTRGFAKRGVIISPDPSAQYPKFLQVFLTTTKKRDNTNDITPADKGRRVTVACFVDTRKWESKATGKTGYTTEATVFNVAWADGVSNVPAPTEAPDELPDDKVYDGELPF